MDNLKEKRNVNFDNGKKNVVADKSFALRIVKLSKHLNKDKKEYVLSKQVLRSGTAVGALIREAEHAQSKADFISKMSISLKETNETVYWLEPLHQSGYIDQNAFDSIGSDATVVLKLLISIVKRSRLNNGKWRIDNEKKNNCQLSTINSQLTRGGFNYYGQ